MILPTSRWIDIQHLSCIFYLLSSSSSSRPNQTTPSAPPAPAFHGWLRLRRPTVRTLQRWSVPPSIPPHVLLFSSDVSPNTHPHLNQSTLVLPSAYDWTGASSTIPVRFVRASPSSSALRPWFVRRTRCTALLRCQHRQQQRGIRR